MASFGTDFHATLEEIVDLVESWMDRYPIFVSAFSFPPNRQVPVTRETIREVLDRADIGSLVFTECPVDPSWTSAYDAMTRVENSLRFNIGRMSSTGLAQSFLSTGNATSTWKKMNAELKKVTTAGATLVCEDGFIGDSRNARFTSGAKALAASGTPLRQDANGTKFIYQPK